MHLHLTHNRKVNEQGFGLLGVLIVIVALVLVGGAGVYAYHRDHKIKTDTTSSTTKSEGKTTATTPSNPTPNPYAGWKTYTSTLGGFSFQYPASWQLTGAQGLNQVAGSQLNGTETSVENWEFPETTNANNFTTQINIASSPAGLALNPPTYSDGSVTTLSNGLQVWETNSSSISNPNCSEVKETPTMYLVSNGNFYMQLSNGKYLSFEANFCGGQKQQTTYSYQQQVNSPAWADGKNMLASFKF
jgi:hypothetical protein